MVAAAFARFGLEPGSELGRGGEASVYAVDSGRVLRLPHVAPTPASVRRRLAFLDELGRARAKVPFAVPRVLDAFELGGRWVTLEERLPGCPLQSELERARGSRREALIRGYLGASSQIADLALSRPYYGDLLRSDAIRTPSFRAYLERRARASLASADATPSRLDLAELASSLPEPERPELVHLDAFAGNMLTDGERISAVIDFGSVSIMGDRRLDPLFSAAYLDPEITPSAQPPDLELARSWLAEAGLAPLYPAARRWIAAFWSECTDDQALSGWCRRVLSDDWA